MTTTTARHCRWADLEQDHPMASVDRRRIVGEKAMISQVHLHAGCCVPTHSHENEQFACVLSGEVRFGVGAEGSAERHEVTLTGGEVLHLPPFVPHSAEAKSDSLVLDIFAPPSATTGVDAKPCGDDADAHPPVDAASS